MKTRVKVLASCACVLSLGVVWAAEVHVDSGDSTALCNAINAYVGTSSTIIIGPGTYDISKCTELVSGFEVDMYALKLKGSTGNPRDVVLHGDGSKHLFWGYGSFSEISGLTVSNSCSTAGRVAQDLTVSNCVIMCSNYAGDWGGALYNCKVYDSELCYNKSTFGGAVSNCKLYNCNVHHNSATYGGAGMRTSAYNCHVHDNVAQEYAGAFGAHNAIYELDGCLIESNVCRGSTYGGGAVYNASHSMDIRNCVFRGNSCSNGTAGAVQASTISNCTFIGNYSNCGGAIAGKCKVFDSRFFGNEARTSGGAAYTTTFDASGLTLRNCIVSNNVSGIHGGGLFRATAFDSQVVMNVVNPSDKGYGGGMYECAVSNCTVSGNAITRGGVGGGGYGGSIYASRVCNNYASSVSALISCSAWDSVVSNNVVTYGGQTIMQANGFFGCRLDVQSIDSPGPLVGCVVSGAGRTVTLAEGDNAYTNGTFAFPQLFVCVMNSGSKKQAMAATNTLFTGNLCATMFKGPHTETGRDAVVKLTSCTIAGNKYWNLVSDAPGAGGGVNGSVEFENVIVSDNRANDDSVARGFNFETPELNKRITVNTCLFDSVSPIWESDIGCTGMTVGSAAFNLSDPDHPYALKYRSPGRDAAIVRDWMTDANDIRGEGFPRLRDGKADIGCYQCWIKPLGMALILR